MIKANDPVRIRADEETGRRQQMERLTTLYNPNTPGVSDYFKTGDQSSIPKAVTIDAASIQAGEARGVQQVSEVNRQPPVVNMSNVFNITGVVDPKAAAASAASQLGAAVKSAVSATHTD